jgi:pimeloyl-ACP methyl ester carboxylesterase
VIAVLDAIGIQAADLVGYSMGGLIALAVAVRFAARVRALVVIGAHPFAQSTAPYRSAVADGLARWLIMIESQGIRLSDQARRRILANDLPALQACVARDRPDWSAALGAFETPLLAIAGAEDPICSAVQAMAEQVGGVYVALAGRNHVSAFLASNEIVTAIEQFLGADAKVVSRTSILAE